ncbi:MAG TPA: sugar phosphate nucleotidyltransferase [Candidatus Saccharimonadales bacterium]|nr:sugar phosphate nucleotidyltransferase [Candidatus Saccharimonadales bacterium]
MIVVIIAGGSGTRLWPLSTPHFPKHLLRLTNDKSMLQNTYDRAKQITDNIYVVTEAGHSDHIFTQLPDITPQKVIIEPGRRGTASCFVASIERVLQQNPDDEPIVFMHADHHIRDVAGFANTVKYAGVAAKKEGKIVLLGVEPDYPATGFGYIQKDEPVGDNGGSFVYKVHSFKEKPAHDVAREYVRSGDYLWNMGYFVAPAAVFLQKMKDFAPDMYTNFLALKEAGSDEAAFKDTYLSFENIAIDYALIEKTPDLLVVPGSFDWVDVGSFADLHEVSELDEQRNHLRGEDIELEGVENSYIRNEDNKSVAVIGLDNVVVVATPHGVLVTRKDLSQKVGDIAKRIHAKNS